MVAAHSRSTIQEQLVKLYLRLNGFFVSGFVVHSATHGKNQTELDALALRLPFSSEPEREIGPDPRLDLSTKYTDLVLCEVKSRGQPLQFNAALRSKPDTVASVLRWSGLFEEAEVCGVADSLCAALAPELQKPESSPTILAARNIRVRAVLFSPERNSRRINQPWFLTGPDIIDYIWKCFCPITPRSFCATTYDFQVWRDHEAIVRYFKSLKARQPGDIRDLYAYVEAGT